MTGSLVHPPLPPIVSSGVPKSRGSATVDERKRRQTHETLFTVSPRAKLDEPNLALVSKLTFQSIS